MKVELRSRGGRQAALIWCPGCRTHKVLYIDPGQPHWTFNGDLERPTFAPSLLSGCHKLDADGKVVEEFALLRCHSFIRNGMIEYLADCHHALRNTTVPMEDVRT